MSAVLGVGLAASALAGTGAGAASAGTQPRCGVPVVESITLKHDLGPCPGDGIVVVASGIRIDLNGHRVVGTPGPDNNVGIRLARTAKVTVKNGTVSDFGAGVAVLGGSANTVTGITAEDNVGLLDGSADFGDGLVILNSVATVLESNVVRHNGPFDGIGVFGIASHDNRVLSNLVENNNLARFAGQINIWLNLDDGINLGAGLEGGSRTTISGNVVRRNGLTGINACSIRGNPCYSPDNVITANIVQSNGFGDPNHFDPFDDGDGIRVVGIVPTGNGQFDYFPPTRDLVADNQVLGNAADGLVVGTSKNRILDNVALGNGKAFPDFFFDLEDLSLNQRCDANTWRNNTYTTAYPDCTTVGGHQVAPPPASSASASASASAVRPDRAAPGPVPARHFPSY